MSADAKLDALMAKLGEVAVVVAVVAERSERTETDVRDVKSALYGAGSRGGLLTRVALLERRGRNWWSNKTLVGAVAGLLVAAATAITAFAAQ